MKNKKSLKFIFVYALLISCLMIACVPSPFFRYETKKFNAKILLDSSYYSEFLHSFEDTLIENGSIKLISVFNRDRQKISDYQFEYDKITKQTDYWPSSGNIKSIKNYKSNKKQQTLDGELKSYNADGRLIRDEIYKKGNFISGHCYDSSGNEVKHYEYEIEPQIDLTELQKCISYPENLRQMNIMETVVLQLFIDKNGRIIEIKYDDDNAAEFLIESIRCIKKIKIEPLYINGIPEESYVHIPILFRLK